MKKLISSLISLISVCTVIMGMNISAKTVDIKASSGSVQDYYYDSKGNKYEKVKGGLSVVDFEPDGYLVNIPDTVDGYKIVEISDMAFWDKDDIKAVTMGKNIKKIGDYAFAKCDNINAFVFSDNTISIGKGAFVSCKSLKSIKLPEKLTELSENLFVGCTGLQEVRMGENVKRIVGCFRGCTSLTDIVIPESVKEITKNTFEECTSLKEIKLPDSATNIGTFLFYKCSSLEKVYMNSPITTNMFDYCTSLKEIEFGKNGSLKNNGLTLYNSFYDVKNEIKITVPDIYFEIDPVFDHYRKIILVGPSGGPVEKAAIEHNFKFISNGTRTKLNLFEYEKNGTIYTKNGEFDTITIKEYWGSEQNVVFPSVINNAIVTQIGYIYDNGEITFRDTDYKKYFSYFPTLKSAVIPSTVKGICFVGYLHEKEIIQYYGDGSDYDWTITSRPIEGFKIYGVKDSYAQKYANNGNFIFEQIKDTFKLPENKTKVTVKKENINLYLKETAKINAKVFNPRKSTTYRSNNSSVVKVSKDGKITALKKGIAKITITNNKVKKVVCVKVNNPKLNKTSVSMRKGKTFNLKITGKIGNATFKTSNKKIATVSKSGKMIAKKKGSANITVKTNGITLKCKVKVV